MTSQNEDTTSHSDATHSMGSHSAGSSLSPDASESSTSNAMEATTDRQTEEPLTDELVFYCTFDVDFCGLLINEESQAYIKIQKEVDAGSHVFSDASHLCKYITNNFSFVEHDY